MYGPNPRGLNFYIVIYREMLKKYWLLFSFKTNTVLIIFTGENGSYDYEKKKIFLTNYIVK